MKIFTALFAVPLLTVVYAVPGDKYWWMNQPNVFGGNSNSLNGNNNQNYNSNQNTNRRVADVGHQSSPQNSYGSNNNNYVNTPVESECPIGTKCVADHFCDANAVMVNYRVDLTQAQKKRRGNMIPCVLDQNSGSAVCCSIPSNPPLASNQGFSQPANNFQGQQQQVQRQPQRPANNQRPVNTNIPTGSCPAINNLPPVESCNGASSNCWSVGQADVDCPGNALCCFDGCSNTCYFGGDSAPQVSQSNLASTFQPQQQNPPPQIQSNIPPPQRFDAPAPPPQTAPPQPAPPQPAPPQPVPQFNDPAPVPVPVPAPVPADPLPLTTPQPADPLPLTTPAAPNKNQFSAPPPQQQLNPDQCPTANPLTPDQCSSERDTCWNTGKRDDCSRGFLCCFDGCVKTCYNVKTGQYLRHPNSQLDSAPQAPLPNNGINPRQQQQQSFNPPPQQQQPQQQQSFNPPAPQPQPKQQPQPQKPYNPPPQQQQSYNPQPQQPKPQKPYNLPPQQQSYNPQPQQPKPAPPQRRQQQQPKPQKPFKPKQSKPIQGLFKKQQQSNNNRNVQPAASKPFVMCPSAMLCVPRDTCDFKGFITEQPLNLTPELEMLRVPLIPCVNPSNQNIDVCCRDPNYKDPWPGGMMMKNGNNNGNNNNFNGNSNNNNNNFRGQNQSFNNNRNNRQQFNNNNRKSGGNRRKGYGK